MGQKLSQETKDRIAESVRKAFAAKRLVKELAQKNQISKPEVCEVVGEVNKFKPGSLIYVSIKDHNKLIEMGNEVYAGNLKRIGYATDELIFKNI